MRSKNVAMMGLLLAGWVNAENAAGGQEGGDGKSPVPASESPFAPDDGMVEASQESDPFAEPFGMWASSVIRIPLARLGEKRNTLQVRVEIWEVEVKGFVQAMDGFEGADAVARWRGQRLKDEQSRLVYAPVAGVDAKSRSSSGAIVERTYPTEYEPPDMLPEKVVEQIVAEKVPESLNDVISSLTSGATPTSFETRNTGTSFEVAVQPVTAEPNCWDVSLAFEDVVLVAMESHGPEAMEVTMPTFSKFNSGGLIRVAEGRWHLVSALAPPKVVDNERAGKSWVTLIRVDPAR